MIAILLSIFMLLSPFEVMAALYSKPPLTLDDIEGIQEQNRNSKTVPGITIMLRYRFQPLELITFRHYVTKYRVMMISHVPY